MPQAKKANSTSRLTRRAPKAKSPAPKPSRRRSRRPGAPAAPPADRVFAAIATYRAAANAYHTSPNDEAGDAHVVALKKMLTCRPTTLRGVAALLECLGEADYGHDVEKTVLQGSFGWGGKIETAAMKLPTVLAQTMRALIGGQS
jgi:hypothetical protein